MNLFENLQIMKEMNENNIDEFVRQAARLFSNDFTEKDDNEPGYNKVIYGSKIDNEFTAIKQGLKSLGFKKLRGYPDFYNDYYRHSCGIDLMCQPLVKNVAKWNLRKQMTGFQFNYDTSMTVNESTNTKFINNLKESKEVYIGDENDCHIIYDANTRKELFRVMKNGGAHGSTVEDLLNQFNLSVIEKPNGVTKPLNIKEPIVTLTVDGSPFESEEDEDEFMLNIKNNYDLNVTFKDRGDYNSYFTFKGTFSEIKRYFSDSMWDDWYLDWEDDEEIKSKYLQSINSDNNADWENFLHED